DRNTMGEGNAQKCVCDRRADEGGMLSLALDDNAKGEDGIDAPAHGDLLDEQRNLERSRHFLDGYIHAGPDRLEFPPCIFDETVDVSGVVLARHDGKGPART